MTNRIGLNINPQGWSDSDIIGLVQRNGATAQLVMGNPGLAQQVHEATGCIAVARHDWPDDVASYPDTLIGEWKGLSQQYPDIVHYWPNEPQPGSLNDFLQATTGFMTQCAGSGLRACLGNFAWPQILQPPDVEDGLWDDFLRVASQWTHAGHGYVGGHEYTTGALPWGCAGRNPNDMANGPLPTWGWPEWPDIMAAADSNWHLFRWAPLVQRCQVLGIPMPLMLVTEGLWDRMPDLSPDLLAKLDAMAGAEVHGINSTRHLFPKFWPGQGDLDSAVDQLRWYQATCPDFVKGFTLFTVSQAPDWQDHNFGAWPDLLNAIPWIAT